MRSLVPMALISAFLLLTLRASADEALLLVRGAPAGRVLAARLDLSTVAERLGAGQSTGVHAVAADGTAIPFQFVPDEGAKLAGTAILVLPPAGATPPRLEFSSTSAGQQSAKWDYVVRSPWLAVTHDPAKMGGLPSRIEFLKTGMVADQIRWQDRAYQPEAGSFRIVDDRDARVERIAEGPLATVVRVHVRYVSADGRSPPGAAEAVYDWYYFHDRPLVYVTVLQRQKTAFDWKELHFLELHPGEAFARYAGGEPMAEGTFSGKGNGVSHTGWAAVSDGRNTIGFVGAGRMLVYDGKGKGYDSYLHAEADAAWAGMSSTARRLSAGLSIASGEQPWAAAIKASKQLPLPVEAMASLRSVQEAITRAQEGIAQLPTEERAQAWWRIPAARRLEAAGRLDEAIRVAAGKLPVAWHPFPHAGLGAIFEKAESGIRLIELYDMATNTPLMAAKPLPIFRLTLRNLDTNADVNITADSGWEQAEVQSEQGMKNSRTLLWQSPADKRLGEMRVVVSVGGDSRSTALEWQLNVDRVPAPWCVRHVVFPQLAIADLGPEGRVLFPRGAGEVQQDVWRRSFNYSGTYPSGWTSMAFAAAYDRAGKTGLYLGTHDPGAGTREIRVESRPDEQAVHVAFEWPAPGMDEPAGGFRLPGVAAWQLFRGDWFDASLIYRNWVRGQESWAAPPSPEGRRDTPLWMRELSAWTMTGGAPEDVVPRVKCFQQYMGVPVGFHWYNWHKIPFDNDYPHYFPTKDGFTAAVAELQSADVYVMPYINGRLWDTRDKGTEDAEFAKRALPGATKREDGKPYTEMYGSKETDDSRVSLAVMCPASEIWRNEVRQIVLRLMNECGVKGVYIDQVAAAQPVLCFDRGHGHPTGGGDWWVPAYARLIGDIRHEMPAGAMLTTECNADPYTRLFDGYLTWHWQYDGQVPAFPAVYGGTVQMFGRAYRGGPTKDLALRMKAGQQLVYGEQIGWCGPEVIDDRPGGEFLRQVVRLRWHLRPFFYAGEMARPPRLGGEIPCVTADWQWSGEWPVTTDALMTGAWRLPGERRLALVFVNVGDEPLSKRLQLDAAAYGFASGELRVTRVTAEGPGESAALGAMLAREVEFPARSAWAWIIEQAGVPESSSR